MNKIQFKRAETADYSAIVALHRANLWQNLTEPQRQDGFLSVDWNEAQIKEANTDLAVMVAIAEQSVVGYMGATTIAYNQQFPLLKAMIKLYQETLWGDRLLNHYRSFIYGPVCVAPAYRGTGVLQGLFQALLSEVAGQYEIGTAFVAQQNQRSFKAHTHKLGMEVLREFEFKGNTYVLLVFPVPSMTAT